MAGAEARLRDFLVGRFGGPQRLHRAAGASAAAGQATCRSSSICAPRDRWVALMEAALAEVQLEPGAAATLRGFFADTATFPWCRTSG